MQQYEDASVEREVDIRKKIVKMYAFVVERLSFKILDCSHHLCGTHNCPYYD